MFLVHRGHTVPCAALRHLHGGEIPHSSCKNPFLQSNRQVQPGPLLLLPLATPVTEHRPLRKASPCWQTNSHGFSSVFVPGTLGNAARLALVLLPGHPIHPLPTPPQAAPAWPMQNPMEHFSAQRPLTLGAFILCLLFSFLPLFVTFNCVCTVPDKLCLCL